MSVKYINRDEKRKVTETMNALLLPMLKYLTTETMVAVSKGLYILNELDIEAKSEETDADSN